MRGRYKRELGTRTLTSKAPRRRRVPPLPEADPPWDPRTVRWWRDAFRSPMAGELEPVDEHGLLRLAYLIERFWTEPTAALSAEIRLQSESYGLTPSGRRRLQLVVEKVEGKKRQPTPTGDDPRVLLMPPKKPNAS